jgi:prepilin-type N-terminal cleavage/methylation domain-containing protein
VIRALAARLRGRDDKGITLVEMMVTMAVGTIVLGVASQLVVQGQRITRSQTTRSTNSAQTGQILDSEAKLIRSAIQTCDQAFDATCNTKPPGVVASSDQDDVWLYSVSGNSYSGSPEVAALFGPVKVHLWVNAAGDFREDVYKPTLFGGICCAYPGSPSTSRILARNVVLRTQSGANAGAPFSYYSGTSTTPLAVPLSAANAALVDHIQLDVEVKASSKPPIDGSRFTYMILMSNVQP